MSIILEPKELTSVSRIKRFAFQIKHELDKLAAIAATDHSIAKGVSDFFGEAFFNLVRDKPTASGRATLGGSAGPGCC